MDRVDRAVSAFKEGFLCSQAILSVYGDGLGLDRETALKLAAGFGGGMGRSGQTCGAVTGALMVIGLAMGHVTAENKAGKAKIYRAVEDFMRAFEKRHGTVNCTQLLGHDLGDPEAYRKVMESRLFTTKCPLFVESAARALERVLASDG